MSFHGRSNTVYDSGDAGAEVGSEKLNAFQRRMLIQTWAHLSKIGGGGIGNVVFKNYLIKRPDLRLMFTKASVCSSFAGDSANLLPLHGKVLNDLLDELINNLSDLTSVSAAAVEFGRQHSHLNGQQFDQDVWDKFGQVMLESITQIDYIRKHRELVRAWMILISYLTDKFRQGYSAGVRRLNFQRHRAATAMNLPVCSADSSEPDGETSAFKEISVSTEENDGHSLSQ